VLNSIYLLHYYMKIRFP